MTSDRTGDLSRASALTRIDADRLSWDVPSGWEQGRGAFGGLVIAALTRAAIESEPDAERVVRAVSCEILVPVSSGRAEVRVEALRRGSGVSAYETRVLQPGEDGTPEVRARATISLGRRRPTDRDGQQVEAPTMPALDACARAPVGPPLAPVFTQHLDFRPTRGLPFSGADTPAVEGFIDAPGASSWGPPEWLALVDCYWPALIALERAPRPMVTLTFQAQLLGSPARGPLFHRGRAMATKDGFLCELRELFTPAGELVVSNVQTIAIVK